MINCNLQQLDGPVRRQRQDRPGAGVVLPRRRLACDQGALGPGLGPAAGRRRVRCAGQQDEHHPGRPVPDLPGRGRGLHPEQLLLRPAAAEDGGQHERRGDQGPLPGRPRLPQGLRRVQGGLRARRPAHGDPGPDGQGVDHRRAGGQERHPPDEEADHQGPQDVPRPALPGDPRQPARGRLQPALLPPGQRLRGDPVPAGAAPGAAAATCRSAGSSRRSSSCRATRSTRR